jgi:LysM repeat protein
MEYDYDHAEGVRGRILWGRFAFWGLALLLMFVLGRCTAGDGVPQARLDERERQIMELQEEVETLNQQLAALSAGEEAPPPPPPDDVPPPEEASSPTYTVVPNDTLNSIAQEKCGSIQAASAIAELNGIDEVNRLRVDQVLELPPECTG